MADSKSIEVEVMEGVIELDGLIREIGTERLEALVLGDAELQEAVASICRFLISLTTNSLELKEQKHDWISQGF
jgi:hypothetical protein